MALTGQLIGQVEINSHADLVHDLLRYKPHDIPSICPHSVYRFDLISGEIGAVGSIICWTYPHEGKTKVTKELIEEVDETNHKIVFKLIEGDLLDVYKAFTITFHVEPKEGKQLVTWTFDFEKQNPSVPDPITVMDLLCSIIKDMDAHTHSK
ncbi:kirola-like [Rutidosis leptorrhynchoides]|uniref:kirola-like n=1 Tax=Rutidosis leptorrhynchoides TaxID=125765 RepID=UPI003A991ED6